MPQRQLRSHDELRQRADLAALIFQAKLRLWRDLLNMKSDPDQPRVPAGIGAAGFRSAHS